MFTESRFVGSELGPHSPFPSANRSPQPCPEGLNAADLVCFGSVKDYLALGRIMLICSRYVMSAFKSETTHSDLNYALPRHV
jgi:hypothetical protein